MQHFRETASKRIFVVALLGKIWGNFYILKLKIRLFNSEKPLFTIVTTASAVNKPELQSFPPAIWTSNLLSVGGPSERGSPGAGWGLLGSVLDTLMWDDCVWTREASASLLDHIHDLLKWKWPNDLGKQLLRFHLEG